jgi:hypothetical protein
LIDTRQLEPERPGGRQLDKRHPARLDHLVKPSSVAGLDDSVVRVGGGLLVGPASAAAVKLTTAQISAGLKRARRHTRQNRGD